MTQTQLQLINAAFSASGDILVFTLEERVFISDEVKKHRKDRTIEMKFCDEIDESCFEKNGEYLGDIVPGDSLRIIFKDPYYKTDFIVASAYYNKDIIKIRKERRR